MLFFVIYLAREEVPDYTQDGSRSSYTDRLQVGSRVSYTSPIGEFYPNAEITTFEVIIPDDHFNTVKIRVGDGDSSEKFSFSLLFKPTQNLDNLVLTKGGADYFNNVNNDPGSRVTSCEKPCMAGDPLIMYIEHTPATGDQKKESKYSNAGILHTYKTAEVDVFFHMLQTEATNITVVSFVLGDPNLPIQGRDVGVGRLGRIRKSGFVAENWAMAEYPGTPAIMVFIYYFSKQPKIEQYSKVTNKKKCMFFHCTHMLFLIFRQTGWSQRHSKVDSQQFCAQWPKQVRAPRQT